MRSQAHIRQYKKLRRRRLLGRLLWMFGFGLLGLGLLHLFSGWMLRPVIVRHLEEQTGAAVYIDSAYWVGPATVRLDDLVIATDPNRISQTAIVQIRRVDCSFSLADLLRLRRQVRSVTVQEAVIQVIYDHDCAAWNFSSLPFMNEPRRSPKVPVIYLDSALLRMQTIQEGRLQTLTSVGLQGQILSEDRGCRYRFSLEATPTVAFYGSRIDGIWNRQKGHGQVTLVGQIQMPLTYIYGNAWNLRQIRLDCLYEKNLVDIQRFSCQMGTGQMDLQGTLTGPPGNRNLDLQVQLENLLLTRTPQADAIVYTEAVLNLLDPGLQRFLRRFQPEGFGDMSLRISGKLSDLAQSQITGQIICRDISVLNQQFPYLLEKMTGRIELTGKNLTLHDLQARHGPSVFVISGRVEEMGPRARVAMHITSRDLLLTEEIKQALSPRLQQTWFEFAPTGKCAIEYDFLRRPDRSKKQHLTVDLLDTSCTYDRYPYPLTNLTGTVVFEPNSVTLKNVTSRPGADQRITIAGTISRLREDAPLCDLHIRTNHLVLDQTFRNTFRKSQRQMLEKFDIDGRLDLDMQVRGTVLPPQPIPFRANMTVQASSMSWKQFPLPFRDLQMKASVNPEEMKIESLTAAYGPDGQCRMSGQIRREGGQPPRFSGVFSVSANDLPLDDPFWKAMQTAGIYPGLLSRVRAQGIVDLDGHFSASDLQTSDFSRQLTIQFKECSLYAPGRDWKSGPVMGTLHVRDRRIDLESCILNQLPVNEAFRDLLPPDKAGILSILEPLAILDVELEHLQWNTDPRLSSFDGKGRIGIHQGTVPRLSLEQLEGFLAGRITSRAGWNSMEGSGTFGARSFCVLGRTVTDLAGPWRADPNTGQWTCEPVSAGCYDGRMLGKLIVQTDQPDWPYQAGVVFENIRLDPLLRAGRLTQQDRTVAEGHLRGSIDLGGRLWKFENNEGRIQLEAADMKLGRESLFGRALTMMQMRRPTEYTFTEMLIEALLKDGVLDSERILLAGENAVYRGAGKLNLADRSIRMELTAFGRRKDQEPSLLSALAENLGAALARVEVTGTLDQPDIHPVPLPILPRPFGLFGPPEEED